VFGVALKRNNEKPQGDACLRSGQAYAFLSEHYFGHFFDESLYFLIYLFDRSGRGADHLVRIAGDSAFFRVKVSHMQAPEDKTSIPVN
jgi:hypothetical protein